MEQVNKILQDLTHHTKNMPVLKDISAKTGLETGHIVAGTGVLLLVCMLFGLGASLITDIIAILYPAYMSFKAIESAETDDDKQWLTYWVVFAIFKVIDDWSEILFSWLPFYYPIKLAFLIFLFAPQTRGALTIYETAIRPILKKHMEDIDASISQAMDIGEKVATIAKEEAIKQGTNIVIKNMAQSSN
eukprot:CAMPEP_0202942716 /NCGR_PEP_ID=MMETSP1395-20130829/2971_1 /ASSEMBLY_ACC=CAM_ASM_000871 /TAXON_ID=5961 /ORGANISM="Blepharisma japonicum, Strain Stock R1072" /LENGTH=188 /DNA_ID=CAMNT_0049639335 /DNA_START=11 /DNA_END=577 /DNA_ORIENTATION=+